MSSYEPDTATARADLCRFLSACYYEPAPEFTEERLFDSILIAARIVHPDLVDCAHRLGQAFATQDLQTLLVDYTRLFLGPMQALAKPYGSSWLPAPATSQENLPLAVLDLYSEGGFDIDDSFMELPDHMAVELEFLYLLNYKCNDATSSGKSDEATAIESLERRFLNDHLGAWITLFAATVTANAETSFYRELAGLTERFVQMEVARLASR
jgi:TorA maturation chaperone TorD